MFLLGLATLVFLALYWTVLPEAHRRTTFVVVSLAVLASYFPLAVAALGALTIAVHLLLGREPRPAWSAALGVTALGLALLALRGSPVLPPAVAVGLSYAVFRLIHFAIERARGKVTDTGLAPLVEYVLFPPSFLSGPIERHPDFARGIDVSRFDLDAAFFGARRILAGLVKKVFLVGALLSASDAAFADPAGGTIAAWRGILAYALYLYLDFSAYCDLAIGVARLFGYRLSENFRWPYLAEDIGEFWRRWHVTLSFWLRDYVYLPLSVKLAENPALRRRPLVVGSASALTTMVACGLWHGNGAAFAAWGLGHGLLVAGHQVYRQTVVARLPAKRRKALLEHPAYRAASLLLTFACVTVLWTFFRFPMPEALHMLARLAGVT